jgi:hypothetical protein
MAVAADCCGAANMLSQAQIEKYRYDGFLFPLSALTPE